MRANTANTKQLSWLKKSQGLSRNMHQLRLLVTLTAQGKKFEFERYSVLLSHDLKLLSSVSFNNRTGTSVDEGKAGGKD